MRTKFLVRLMAVFAVFALVVAACGDDDDDDGGDGGATDGGGEAEDIEAAPATDRLVIGRILPETGGLAPLGPPMFVGVQLALEDINAAGGVLGQPAEAIDADEGGDAARISESLSRVLGEGANAIVGAAASGQTQEIIQTLSDEEIPECSPSNTSPAFTSQENANYYFRTVPPDNAIAPVFADKIIADGRTNVALVARQDDYGELLLEETSAALEAQGVTIAAEVTYDPEATTFDSEVEELSAASPDAIVVITFSEGAALVGSLLESGFTPDQLYGGDGIFTPTFDTQVNESDPAALAGMVFIAAAGGAEFNARVNEQLDAENQGNVIYGGQSYDCVVVLALAAEAAGAVSGPEMMAQVIPVTRDGTECTDFASCKALLDAGEDIDYTGVGGPLNLDAPEGGGTDPTFGRYAIAVSNGDTLDVIGEQDVDLSQL